MSCGPSMRWLAFALLFSAGCVTFGADERLTRIATEEWARSGAGDRYASVSWVAHYCWGSPAAWPDTEARVLRIAIPSCFPESGVRALMRYEMSKIAWQMRARAVLPSWLYWLAQVDAFAHLPPSELHSWYRVIWS